MVIPRRSTPRALAGVCAGLAQEGRWNVWLVRLAFVLTFPISAPVYLALVIVMRPDPTLGPWKG